jgi:hypothetical protein
MPSAPNSACNSGRLEIKVGTGSRVAEPIAERSAYPRRMVEDRGAEFDGVRIGRPATGALLDAGYRTIADLPADLDGLLTRHGVAEGCATATTGQG